MNPTATSSAPATQAAPVGATAPAERRSACSTSPG